MFSDLDTQTRQIVTGNLLLILCCIFYLAWWLIAFHPTHGIRGFKTGWLLIPAFIFGLWAVIRTVGGCRLPEDASSLLSRPVVVIGGIVLYVILLLVTNLLLKRMVTSELLLIVGWIVLMFIELNALYGLGRYTAFQTVALLVITVIAAAVSLICYLLYYNLGKTTGYVDGMIPLLIVAIMMAMVTIGALRS